MEYWYLTAIFASFFTAIFVYVNQILKIEPVVGMIYRGVVVATILLPFAFFIEPVANPYFYVICILQGFLVYFFDIKIFKLSKDIGAEATSLYQPLGIIAVFVAWIFITPSEFIKVLDNKVLFGAELFCMLLIAVAIFKIKNSTASKGTLSLVTPLIFYIIVIDILHKTSVGMSDDLLAAVFYYNFISAIVVGFCSVISYKKHHLKFDFCTKKTISLWGVAIVMCLAAGCKSVSMFYTPNPGYVSAIIGTMPLWIIGINFVLLRLGFISSAKRIDIRYMSLLVASVCGLILLANY